VGINLSKIYLLNSDKFENIQNLPVIKINFFKQEIDFDLYDALIFTSKNAVRAVENINHLWRTKEIYSIGKGTSKEINKYSANLVMTSKNSYGDTFAQEIKAKLQGKKVLFPRAKVVTSKLNQILLDCGIDLEEKILYETTCEVIDKKNRPEKNSVIIFTSPSTVNCFLKNFDWDESYKAICIGKVTSKAIQNGIKVIYSDKQTISSCIEKAKQALSPLQ
jgi:uroporphyrinogen-III synthase